MAICLNSRCQNIIPSESAVCTYCGGREISTFRRFSYEEEASKEITMENFEKITKRAEAKKERVQPPHSGKGSKKSKIAVRAQYLKRRIFFAFRNKNQREW